jgi:hypothetical protein
MSACAYEVPITASPAFDVYSNYRDKIPGRFALFIDASSFAREVKPTGHICSANSYPLNANASFKQSAVNTIEQLVEQVEVVERPLPVEELTAKGYHGQIVIKSDEYTARITFVPGFWSATASSSVDVSASLVVDGADGRFLGTSASASRSSELSSASCGDGAQAIADANSKATKELLGRLGERLANEPRLRQPQAQMP